MPIRSAAKAIVVKDGQILLNRSHNNKGVVYYELPGGGQKHGEPLNAAVVRECLEETGYRVRITGFAGICEEIRTGE